MAQTDTDNLVRAIKRPFKAVADALSHIPDRKPKTTDMHQKRVEYANKTFRDASEKKAARKPTPKKAAARTSTKRTSKAASKGRKSSSR